MPERMIPAYQHPGDAIQTADLVERKGRLWQEASIEPNEIGVAAGGKS